MPLSMANAPSFERSVATRIGDRFLLIPFDEARIVPESGRASPNMSGHRTETEDPSTFLNGNGGAAAVPSPRGSALARDREMVLAHDLARHFDRRQPETTKSSSPPYWSATTEALVLRLDTSLSCLSSAKARAI